MESRTHLIIPATDSEIKLILDLAERIWPATYHFLPDGQVEFMLKSIYTEQALLKQMQQGQKFVLLYKSEQAVGFASYSIKVREKQAKLNKLYLLPELQGYGFGKQLIRYIEAEAEKAGCRQILLNVNKFNPALNFYKSQGYAILKEENIPIGQFFMEDYVMIKNIKG